MKCPYCGSEIGEALLFCPSCGEKIQETERIELSSVIIEQDNYSTGVEKKDVERRPEKKKSKFLIPLLIVGIFVVIFMAFSVGRMSGNNVPSNTNSPEISKPIADDNSEDTVTEQDLDDANENKMSATQGEEVATEAVEEETAQTHMETGSETWENITFSIQRTDTTTALLTIESQDSSGQYYFGPHMGYDSPVVLDLLDGSQVETSLDKNLFWQQNDYNMEFVSGTNVTMVLKFDDGADAAWDAVHICVTSLSMMGNGARI